MTQGNIPLFYDDTSDRFIWENVVCKAVKHQKSYMWVSTNRQKFKFQGDSDFGRWICKKKGVVGCLDFGQPPFFNEKFKQSLGSFYLGSNIEGGKGFTNFLAKSHRGNNHIFLFAVHRLKAPTAQGVSMWKFFENF